MLEQIFDVEKITSKTNSTIVKISKLVNKKYRNEYEIFVCDGVKLFKEAIEFGANIEYLIIKDDFELSEDIIQLILMCKNKGTKVLIVEKTVFSKITEENSPQGIITVCSFLKAKHRRILVSESISSEEKIMMFEAIRDPGNLGTIIRNAAAFGIDRIILSSDCVDIYSHKVIRAAMGALFKLKIDIVSDFVGTIKTLKKSGKRVLSATLGENSLLLGKEKLNKNDVIVIGNEGHGLTKEVISSSNDTILIPMENNTESLNAAMASVIFMWELYK